MRIMTPIPSRFAGKPRLLVVSLLLSQAFSAFGQTPADIQRAQQEATRIQQQEQLREQRDRADALRQRAPSKGLDTSTLTPQVKAPDLGLACRDIKEIVITGAPNLPESKRAEIVAPFVGRCLAVGDFEKLLSAVTAYYVQRGLITTRVYVPQQDLSKGRLELLVVEGTVEKILIQDGDKKSVSVGNAFPGVEGSLFNLRDIEQGLDQINRLSSNNATMEVQPGSKAGDSVVVINNQPKPTWHVMLTYDNQASISTGNYQVGATASVDNLFGLDDFASFTHRFASPGDRESVDSDSDSFTYLVPYGYNTYSMGVTRSRYVSVLNAPSGLTLRSEGNSKNVFAKYERVVYRDQDSRASLAGTITAKQSLNYLASQLLQISSRNLTVFDLDSNYTTRFLGGSLSLDLGFARGINIAGALTDYDVMSDVMPRAQFRKLKYGFNFNRPFRVAGLDGAFNSQLTGQKAFDALYGSEQIYVTGIYGVRGYVKNSLAGDNGFFWRNDLSVKVPTTIMGKPATVKPFVALDLGRVTQWAQSTFPSPEGSVTGAAAGFSVNAGPATWEIFTSRPLDKPSWMTREGFATFFRVIVNI